MTKKEKFVNVIEALFRKTDMLTFAGEDYDDVMSFFEELKAKEEKKPFTEKGIAILKFLQTTECEDKFKAKEIGEQTFLTGHSVSGAIRKLVSDGYVSKLGKDPVLYSITESGKGIDITQYEVDK